MIVLGAVVAAVAGSAVLAIALGRAAGAADRVIEMQLAERLAAMRTAEEAESYAGLAARTTVVRAAPAAAPTSTARGAGRRLHVSVTRP
jgi:hypothetical protein